MRTTVTLDPDTAALLQRVMKERGIGFKQALNDVLRRALTGGGEDLEEVLPVRSMGSPMVNLDKALQLAGELEDEELLRKTRLGK